MKFKDDNEVIEFLKKSINTPDWVKQAREKHLYLDALVTGNNFDKLLINKIEHIESEQRAAARKKYSKDIRSLFARILQPRSNVFTASGGSVVNDIKSETIKTKVVDSLNEFKGQKSIEKYLSETFFNLQDVDPNGVLFLEYIEDKDIYPTYKSIADIHDYKSNGQLLEYIIFAPVNVVEGNNPQYQEWRIVDDVKDYRIKQSGQTFTIITDKTFEHPFGNVPAVILSNINKSGSEVRLSPLNPIEPDAEDYARDKSILTIYKYQVGFPDHWRYEKECRSCKGSTVAPNGTDVCKVCNGKGNMRKNDVTDITIIDLPREGDPIVAPNLAGFNAPDLETWRQYKVDLIDWEHSMESTMWGTRKVEKETMETATGRVLDVQPLINELNEYADSVEWVHNQFTDWVIDWVNGSAQEEHSYTTIYGRGYIVESSEALLERYNLSVKDGSNNTILDKQLSEYINAKYQNNAVLRNEMQLKSEVEPYIHTTTINVHLMFGAVEANKKVLFVDFWEQSDREGDAKKLISDFDTYFATNNSIKPPEPTAPKPI